ncbi:MAG: type I methionyl aminopeptidase [Acidimicrobiia bacterium]
MTEVGTLKANDPCFCGSGKKFKRCHKDSFDHVRPGRLSAPRTVPEGIERPPYADVEGGVPPELDEPDVQPPEVIEAMRRAGRVAAEVLAETGAAVRPGITTDELDRICHEACLARDAYPSPLGYRGYPKSLCTSVNEVICHGIPDSRALLDGDIVNLDVTTYVGGVHGDTNATFLVGSVDPESRRLVRVTRECLERGIEAVGPGVPFNAIGRAIQVHAEDNGFGVVRAFVGHGIGRQFHSGLHVPHYYVPSLTMPMEPGTTFTIEPMITAGSWQHRLWDDQWTAVTSDLRRTAQFEHTILVTDDGAEVLTALPG